MLRRSAQSNKSDMILESNGIRIDMSERVCWKGEAVLSLTLAEYKLLCLFLRRKIEDDPNVPTKLLTEIGFGYKWAV